MVATVVSLTVQVASARGRPRSSTAVNCCVSPTAKFTFAGVIWRELGKGKGASSFTCIFVKATFPAESVARTTTRLTPGFSEMLQEKSVPVSVTGTPLQVSELIPDKPSETVPEAVIPPAAVKTAPSAGEARWRLAPSYARVEAVLSL